MTVSMSKFLKDLTVNTVCEFRPSIVQKMMRDYQLRWLRHFAPANPGANGERPTLLLPPLFLLPHVAPLVLFYTAAKRFQNLTFTQNHMYVVGLL